MPNSTKKKEHISILSRPSPENHGAARIYLIVQNFFYENSLLCVIQVLCP
jgi:hypothetical protein